MPRVVPSFDESSSSSSEGSSDDGVVYVGPNDPYNSDDELATSDSDVFDSDDDARLAEPDPPGAQPLGPRGTVDVRAPVLTYARRHTLRCASCSTDTKEVRHAPEDFSLAERRKGANRKCAHRLFWGDAAIAGPDQVPVDLCSSDDERTDGDRWGRTRANRKISAQLAVLPRANGSRRERVPARTTVRRATRATAQDDDNSEEELQKAAHNMVVESDDDDEPSKTHNPATRVTEPSSAQPTTTTTTSSESAPTTTTQPPAKSGRFVETWRIPPSNKLDINTYEMATAYAARRALVEEAMHEEEVLLAPLVQEAKETRARLASAPEAIQPHLKTYLEAVEAELKANSKRREELLNFCGVHNLFLEMLEDVVQT